MPPPLALLLCTIFVLFLLRLERQNSVGVSAASWIPTIWMLASSSKSLAIWFGKTGTNESGSMSDQLLLMGLAAAAIVVLARRRFDWSGTLRSHGWLFALVAYGFISTSWSDITLIAVRRWTRDVIAVVMAFVIMSEANPRNALEGVLRRSAYILIPFSLMLIKYYQRLGVRYERFNGSEMWTGVTVHKNALGALCLVSCFFLLWALYRRCRGGAATVGRYQGWADLSVLLIALSLLRGAEKMYSATAIGSLAVGVSSLLSLLWLRRRHVPVPKVGLLAVVVLVIGFGLSAPFLGGSNLAVFSSSLGRDETLTGRTKTWAELVPVVKTRPLLGFGYASFWTTARQESYEMSYGHNGYLDILLELGGLGLACYIAWFLSCARKLHGAFVVDYGWASFAICFLLLTLIYNATESALTLASGMTPVLVMSSLAVPDERIRGSHKSHLRVPMHLPAQRLAGAVAPQSSAPGDRRTVHVLGCRSGQRRGRRRTRDGGQSPGGSVP